MVRCLSFAVTASLPLYLPRRQATVCVPGLNK
jgi:hypothetical protein